MSVIDVRPFANSQGGVDAEGNRSYTNLYDVYTDDKNDGSITARFAAGIPAHGDYWIWYNDFDEYALCVTRSAELIDVDATRKKWRVTCTFSTALQKRDPASPQTTPEYEPWKISGSFAIGTKAVSRDREGKAVTNSAEEEIISEIPDAYDTLILEGNTATIDLAARAAVKLKCNKDPMWGLDARHWLLMQWSWDIGYRGPTPYVHNRLEWHASGPDGWNLVAIDKGTRTIIDVAQTDPKLRYKPASAQDVQLLGGIYLNGSGQPYDIKANPLGFELKFELIDEIDFLAAMPFLPDPLPGPFV